jgi:hypothetical protein
MPPAFALSQDQTLRFIQASLQSIHPTATPKRTSKGSSLSPKNSQPTSNNQAPSRNTQNKYPQRSTRPGADRASRHSSQQGKNTQQQSPAPNHPKIAKHYQLPKKPDAIVKQQKKNQQQNTLRHPTSPAPSTTPIIGRAKTLAKTKQPVKPKNHTTSR